ncbi:MAG: VOC family protein [SAR86 cluster bacterium]|jgi:catechol 2,3-dioxygenase-like lactoylglutathione lyase family enzyme|nr:VOC family protein [SAR86 cluster bacterium]|tara:strand:+ start:4099 stop:4488 length:390 start_codon:yes stop_codon:yes gene_type:complete
MFSHVMLGANNIEESKIFYDALLGVLGGEPGVLSPNTTGQKRYFYFLDNMAFCISEPIDGNEATHGNGGTIGFSVKNTETGDAWHAAGIENGGTACEEPPGIREGGGFKTYLAYLRDPSGNKLCALLRM